MGFAVLGILLLWYNGFGVIQMENNLEKATGILQKLSVESLKTAISLLELLALKEELDATEEIRSDDEINRQINKAQQAHLQGKQVEYIPWEMRHSV